MGFKEADIRASIAGKNEIRSGTPMLDAALDYLSHGLAVLPIRGGTGEKAKSPLLGTWKQYQNELPKREDVESWFTRWPDADVAIVCGWHGLAVLDIDDADLADRIVKDGKVLSTTKVATSPSGGLHIYLREERTSRNGPVVAGVADIKASGGYIISPPSRDRRWIDKAGGSLEVPNAREWAERFLEGFGVEVHKEASSKRERDAGGAEINEGERHTTLVASAGRLRYQRYSLDDITEELLRENERRCRPPLSETEVVQIAESMANYDPGPFPLSDLGNAERLVARYGRDLRYCHELGTWFVWRGTHWGENDDGEVERRANETARSIRTEAEHEKDPQRSTKLHGHAIRSEGRYGRDMMIKMAEDLIPTQKETFDSDPYLLNVLDGTIDLRTGELLEHDRENMITKLIPLKYNRRAKAPRWRQFLDEIFEGDAELVDFVQRAVGYSLTGNVSEQILFLCHGIGANGKSKFLEAISHVMGPYARAADPDLLLARLGDAHPTSIADLFGKRLATTIETKKGRSFDEQKLQWLTGGDKLAARKMHQDFFEFWPTHKFWIATNHLPNVEVTREAFWRRIIAIPFTRVFSPSEQDPELSDTLAEEARGILAWAVQGCVAWNDGGGLKVNLPERIREAQGKYRRENDQIIRFIEQVCLLDADGEDEDGEEGSQHLYDAYKAWCAATKEKTLSLREWSPEMERLGIKKKNKRKGAFWIGITIKATWEERLWHREEEEFDWDNDRGRP